MSCLDEFVQSVLWQLGWSVQSLNTIKRNRIPRPCTTDQRLMRNIFEIFYFLFCLKSQPYIHKYLITTFNKEYITLQWIQTSTLKKKKKQEKKQNFTASRHPPLSNGAIAWACMSWRGRGGWVWAGLAALDLSGPVSADLSRYTASRSSRLTPAILTLSLCLLLWAPVGQRLFWKWHSGSRTNSKGATRTEGALMENVHPLINDFTPSVFVLSTATHLYAPNFLFFLRALNN